MSWLGPVLGSIVFWWGGWPFLAGGVAEIRDRQPGMMLLISMAITVAYGVDGHQPRLARPRVLVGARRAGHDHAARPLAGDEGDRPGPQAPSPRSPSCCPTTPSASTATTSRRSPSTSCASATSSSSAPAAGSRPTADRRRRGRARRVDDHRRVPPGRQGRRRPRGRRHRVDRLVAPRPGRRRRRGHRAGRDPAARRRGPGEPQPRPGARRPLRRLCCSTSRRRRRRHLRRLDARSATSTTPSCARSPCS